MRSVVTNGLNWTLCASAIAFIAWVTLYWA